MKPYNPKKFVPGMCKIAHNLTLKYILHKYILGYFGNQQKATDQINSRLNKQQKTTDFKKQQISKTIDFKNSGFQKTDFKNNS